MSTNVISVVAVKALDGLYARQAATAQNIANAGSANYAPVRVVFEEALRQAWVSTQTDGLSQSTARVEDIQPTLVDGSLSSGEGVKIDQEITTASETSSRYALLIGMLDRTMQFKQLSIKGG